MLSNRPYDFSYSGLKTSVMHHVRGKTLNQQEIYNVAASFQHAAFESVRLVLERAIDDFCPRSLIFGGGVTANQALRSYIPSSPKTFWPTLEMSIDNAAMIAGLGYHKLITNPSGDPLTLAASPRMPL